MDSLTSRTFPKREEREAFPNFPNFPETPHFGQPEFPISTTPPFRGVGRSGRLLRERFPELYFGKPTPWRPKP